MSKSLILRDPFHEIIPRLIQYLRGINAPFPQMHSTHHVISNGGSPRVVKQPRQILSHGIRDRGASWRQDVPEGMMKVDIYLEGLWR